MSWCTKRRNSTFKTLFLLARVNDKFCEVATLLEPWHVAWPEAGATGAAATVRSEPSSLRSRLSTNASTTRTGAAGTM